jgi:hypothetical protein
VRGSVEDGVEQRLAEFQHLGGELPAASGVRGGRWSHNSPRNALSRIEGRRALLQPPRLLVQEAIGEGMGVEGVLVAGRQGLADEHPPAVAGAPCEAARNKRGVEPPGRAHTESQGVVGPEQPATGHLGLEAGHVEVGDQEDPFRQKEVTIRATTGVTLLVQVGDQLVPFGAPPAQDGLLKTFAQVHAGLARHGNHL